MNSLARAIQGLEQRLSHVPEHEPDWELTWALEELRKKTICCSMGFYAGLEAAAEFMESRKVTASEFYRDEIRKIPFPEVKIFLGVKI